MRYVLAIDLLSTLKTVPGLQNPDLPEVIKWLDGVAEIDLGEDLEAVVGVLHTADQDQSQLVADAQRDAAARDLPSWYTPTPEDLWRRYGGGPDVVVGWLNNLEAPGLPGYVHHMSPARLKAEQSLRRRMKTLVAHVEDGAGRLFEVLKEIQDVFGRVTGQPNPGGGGQAPHLPAPTKPPGSKQPNQPNPGVSPTNNGGQTPSQTHSQAEITPRLGLVGQVIGPSVMKPRPRQGVDVGGVGWGDLHGGGPQPGWGGLHGGGPQLGDILGGGVTSQGEPGLKGLGAPGLPDLGTSFGVGAPGGTTHQRTSPTSGGAPRGSPGSGGGSQGGQPGGSDPGDTWGLHGHDEGDTRAGGGGGGGGTSGAGKGPTGGAPEPGDSGASSAGAVSPSPEPPGPSGDNSDPETYQGIGGQGSTDPEDNNYRDLFPGGTVGDTGTITENGHEAGDRVPHHDSGGSTPNPADDGGGESPAFTPGFRFSPHGGSTTPSGVPDPPAVRWGGFQGLDPIARLLGTGGDGDSEWGGNNPHYRPAELANPESRGLRSGGYKPNPEGSAPGNPHSYGARRSYGAAETMRVGYVSRIGPITRRS